MTSSNGNISRVTGLLCGEFTGPGDFPHKGQWRGAFMFSLFCPWMISWVNNCEAGDLRRHHAHYDVNVMNSRMAWNDAQSLKQHRRGALFSKIIHQISRSHATKYRQFRPELSVSRLQLQFEFTDEMMHRAWHSNVMNCFSRSSVKFQGHRGWKIDDFNPIWVRLLGWSQLSNPPDLPCSTQICSLWFN